MKLHKSRTNGKKKKKQEKVQLFVSSGAITGASAETDAPLMMCSTHGLLSVGNYDVSLSNMTR